MSEIFNFLKKCNFDKNSIILEIGSHMGLDTEKIKDSVNNSKIYCFEPDPRNIKIMLQRKVDNFAIINELAISNKNSNKENFYLSSGKPVKKTGISIVDDNDWTASNSLREPKLITELHPWCKFTKNIFVKTKTLDSYCKENDIFYINFIWMDVQGAEDLVFLGGKKILSNTEYIYTEFANKEIYKDQKKLEHLISLLPGDWKILFIEKDDVLIENVSYRKKFISHNGIWNIKNFNEHVFDHSLACEILNFLKKNNCKNCLDLGCGPGQYTSYLNLNSIQTDGYDGNPHTPEISNLTCGILDLSILNNLNKLYDCVLSLEVGEHIPKIYEDIYIKNLILHSKKFIIISWAIPNQNGYGHVNCQENKYIKNIFKKYGYKNLTDEENILREKSSADWFKKTIMIFEKE